MAYAFGMLALYVEDIKKATEFYTEFLDFQIVSDFSGPEFVYLQPAAGTPIAIQHTSALPSKVSSKPGGFEINLQVDDIKATWQIWKEKGIAGLTEISDMGAGLWFRANDTEGHILAVYQLYPQFSANK